MKQSVEAVSLGEHLKLCFFWVTKGDNGSLWFWDWKSGHNFQQTQTIVQPGVYLYCSWLLLFVDMRELSNIDLYFCFRFTG